MAILNDIRNLSEFLIEVLPPEVEGGKVEIGFFMRGKHRRIRRRAVAEFVASAVYDWQIKHGKWYNVFFTL